MRKCALLIALLAVSCQMVHRVTDTAAELFGDAVVARVGEHRLMRSELAEYIPAGVSSEDSLGLAQQYIKHFRRQFQQVILPNVSQGKTALFVWHSLRL